MTRTNRQYGFTLIELIITVVLVAIFGAFFVQFMGDKILRSPDVVLFARDEGYSEEAMEDVVSEFVAQINGPNPDNTLTGIATDIAAGTFATRPGVTVQSSWITFDAAGNETPGSSGDMLKVTVTVSSDGSPKHRFVTVLGQSRITGKNNTPVNY